MERPNCVCLRVRNQVRSFDCETAARHHCGVRSWADKTDIPVSRFLPWIGIGTSKFHDWQHRFGKVNVVIRRRNGQLAVAQEPLPEMPGELKQLLQERK